MSLISNGFGVPQLKALRDKVAEQEKLIKELQTTLAGENSQKVSLLFQTP